MTYIPRPEIVEQDHLEYLDDLRDSGETNMYAASPYVADEFCISREESRTILSYWMKTFGARHA